MTALFTISAPAENSPEIVTPVLIVWAKTELPNNGTPTVNLVDLERYFVDQLRIRRFDYVFPHATAKLSSRPDENVYLLELSVDALQSAARATRDQQGAYHDDPVFVVELSVTVKHPLSGQVLGKRIAPAEYHMSEDELQELGPKRHALYTTADRLAEFVANEVSQGNLGQQMSVSQRPLPAPPADPPWFFLGAGILVLIMIACLAANTPAAKEERARAAEARRQEHEKDKERRQQQQWDELLDRARDFRIETRDYSADWYEAAAAAKCEEVLKCQAETRRNEAERRNRVKEIDEEYQRIAAYAVARHHLDADEIVNMLRKADERQFRLLEEAIKIKEEQA